MEILFLNACFKVFDNPIAKLLPILDFTFKDKGFRQYIWLGIFFNNF